MPLPTKTTRVTKPTIYKNRDNENNKENKGNKESKKNKKDQENKEKFVSKKVKGVVLWFNSQKGQGYLRLLDANIKYYIHKDNIVDFNPENPLKTGYLVKFDIIIKGKGFGTINIQVTDTTVPGYTRRPILLELITGNKTAGKTKSKTEPPNDL